MESNLSAVCFVRCPKCLRVLAEFPDIPLFKCYGCDAILKAEAHSDNCSSENGIAIYLKQISNASDEPKKLEQPEEAKRSEDSNSKGENKIEESAESLENDDTKNREGNEDHKNGVGFRWKTRSPDAYDRNLSLSDKFQQFHVTQKNFTLSRRTRSSNSFDRSFSSSIPQNNLSLSRRTRSSKVLDSNQKNTFSSENHEISLTTQSKETEHGAKFHFSKTEEKVKILEKVDELKIDLHRMFSNKSDGKKESNLNIKVAPLNGKIESDEERSSPFGFSRQSGGSNGKRRLWQKSQLRHCRPVSGGSPFVICYRCFKLLQLPVDFLVSAKRIHKLRCGSCSEVLAYSFRPRSRAVVERR